MAHLLYLSRYRRPTLPTTPAPGVNSPHVASDDLRYLIRTNIAYAARHYTSASLRLISQAKAYRLEVLLLYALACRMFLPSNTLTTPTVPLLEEQTASAPPMTVRPSTT